jgi:hypothetical protein
MIVRRNNLFRASMAKLAADRRAENRRIGLPSARCSIDFERDQRTALE